MILVMAIFLIFSAMNLKYNIIQGFSRPITKYEIQQNNGEKGTFYAPPVKR
jgi:hypothetical protein